MKHPTQPPRSDLDLLETLRAKSNSIPSFSKLLQLVIRMIAILLLQLGLLVPATAQRPELSIEKRILLRQAMLDIDRLEYDKAISKLLLVRDSDSINPNLAYLLGRSYLYSNRPRSLEKAIFYLTKASVSPNDDYLEWDLDEQDAPMEVFYHLGKAQEKLGLYEPAAESYENLLDHLAKDANIHRSKMYDLIMQNAKDCQMASLSSPATQTDSEETLSVQHE